MTTQEHNSEKPLTYEQRRYARDREKRLAASRKYYKEHKEQISKKQKAKYKENPEPIKARSRAYHHANKEKCNRASREYYNKHRERLSKANSEWNKAHREQVNAWLREWSKEYKKKNPNVKIYHALRRRLSTAVRKYGKDREWTNIKTEELIGCTIQELMAHLESKFVDGMSWDNYGVDGWHIDHIVPCSAFDFNNEDDAKRCNHYTNLQPLWAADNIRKRDKVA
jgi:signal recognition particle GTPase